MPLIPYLSLSKYPNIFLLVSNLLVFVLVYNKLLPTVQICLPEIKCLHVSIYTKQKMLKWQLLRLPGNDFD